MDSLTEKQLTFWKNNSYLSIENLFGNEIKGISSWVNEISLWPDNNSKWITNYEFEKPHLLSRRENFCPYHEKLDNILRGEKIINIISKLMGEEAALYKDRINFKYPGGGPHAAHQDGIAYETKINSFFNPELNPYISVLISIDKATEENGCLEIVPDWNGDKLDILRMESPFPDRPEYRKIAKSIEDSLYWEKIPTSPGDALFFTERLPHRSQKNNSNKTRRILYGVYNPLSEGDKRESYFSRKKLNLNDPQYMIGNPHKKID